MMYLGILISTAEKESVKNIQHEVDFSLSEDDP